MKGIIKEEIDKHLKENIKPIYDYESFTGITIMDMIDDTRRSVLYEPLTLAFGILYIFQHIWRKNKWIIISPLFIVLYIFTLAYHNDYLYVLSIPIVLTIITPYTILLSLVFIALFIVWYNKGYIDNVKEDVKNYRDEILIAYGKYKDDNILRYLAKCTIDDISIYNNLEILLILVLYKKYRGVRYISKVVNDLYIKDITDGIPLSVLDNNMYASMLSSAVYERIDDISRILSGVLIVMSYMSTAFTAFILESYIIDLGVISITIIEAIGVILGLILVSMVHLRYVFTKMIEFKYLRLVDKYLNRSYIFHYLLFKYTKGE